MSMFFAILLCPGVMANRCVYFVGKYLMTYLSTFYDTLKRNHFTVPFAKRNSTQKISKEDMNEYIVSFLKRFSCGICKKGFT